MWCSIEWNDRPVCFTVKIEPYHEWLFKSVDLEAEEGYFPLDDKYVDTN